MTGRERFLKTIAGEATDHMPVTLFIQDQGHFLEQCYPEADPHDYFANQCRVVDLQRKFGCDVFVRMLFGVTDPLHIHMGGVDITHQSDNWQVHSEERQEGATHTTRYTITTPGGLITQENSVVQMSRGTFLYATTEKPVKTEADLDIVMEYEPRMPAGWEVSCREKVQRMKEYVGDDGIVGVWAPHGPFNNASLLIDHQELYSLFLVKPAYYDKLMRYASERILDYTRAMAASGADVLHVGGNVPGGFLGKRIYDKYVLPYERDYITVCQENGTPAMYHNCGQIMNLVESYKEVGLKMVEPFSPPPLGDADLAKAKQLVNGDYVMLVGVDQVNVIQKGTVADVVKATKETALTGKHGGKTIIQSADFLEMNTPLENVQAFVDTAKEYGAYE
ncbi:hypothetical protein LJB76_02045 [Clostridia bacterium OttesenSCG-928-O13]|nr:hypothetical protein [Clostridia bacterium OttesenSCG-928-O13]